MFCSCACTVDSLGVIRLCGISVLKHLHLVMMYTLIGVNANKEETK